MAGPSAAAKAATHGGCVAATVHALNVTKVYREGPDLTYAVDNISLQVQPGEFVAVVGRSGSGKSSLLHVLGSLQKPDSGGVALEGVDLAGLDEDGLYQLRVNRIGFIFQAFNLLPNETVLRNVDLPLREQGVSAWDRQERTEKALRAVGLEHRPRYIPAQLSASQRQFVAIARAIVTSPAVIFADEPTRGLDSTSREEVMGIFQRLNDEGHTIVIATAESGVASYCRRAVRIAEGRSVDDAPVQKRRIIPEKRIPGPPPRRKGEVAVCPRCDYDNPPDREECLKCYTALDLTKEEQQSIEGRLTGAGTRWLGVESTSDEGEVPGREMVDELKRVPFFVGLGSKSLAKILPALKSQTYDSGTPIVEQGGPPDSFHIIRTGKVKVVIRRERGSDIAVAELGPGEAFGEMALLTNQPRSATVVASTEVETWLLPREPFTELIAEHPSLALYFNRILSQRLRSLQERVLPYI